MEGLVEPRNPTPRAKVASRTGSGVGEALLFGVVLLATRVLCAVLIAWLTHGREFSDDVSIHLEYASHPFSRLLGTTTSPPYPPLQGLLTGLTVDALNSFLGHFFILRVAFSVFEAAALSLTIATLHVLRVELRTRLALAVVVIVAPVGWMSGAVMAQEESIGTMFVAAAILAEVKGHRHLTLFLLSLGAVTAKAFFIFPLATLFLLSPEIPLKRRLFWAATPLVAAYGTMALSLLVTGRTVEDFTLPVFGVSIWKFLTLLFPLSEKFCERGSVVAIGLGMLGLFWLARRAPDSPTRGIATLSAALCGSLLLFYHSNPEYFEMVLPAVVVLFPRVRPASLLAMLLSLPWSTNVVDGVANVTAASPGGKAAFARLYFRWVSITPAKLSPIALTVAVLSLAVVAAMLASRLRGPAGNPQPSGSRRLQA